MLLTVCARLFLRLLVLSLLLCAALSAFGGRPLAPNEAWDMLGFSTCELPCYVGVMPGQTAYRRAPDVVRKGLPLVGRRMFFNSAVLSFWASSEHYELAGWAGYNQDMVGELRLTVLLPFDHLIDQLGTPDCVLPRIPPTERTGVYWVRGDVSVVALLSLGQHNFTLSTLSPGLWLRAFRKDDCAVPEAIPWHGFTSTAEYLP